MAARTLVVGGAFSLAFGAVGAGGTALLATTSSAAAGFFCGGVWAPVVMGLDRQLEQIPLFSGNESAKQITRLALAVLASAAVGYAVVSLLSLSITVQAVATINLCITGIFVGIAAYCG